MTTIIDGQAGITFNDASVQGTAGYTGFRNRIINGDMRIDQRNAGASVTAGAGTYTLDRWQAYSSQASKFTVQQNAGSVTPPSGFTNYLGVTSLAATTVGSDLYRISQAVEGYNIADFAWGTGAGKTVTLSFWVYSSLTGNFSICLQNSANTRAYPALYNIASANTWTYISLIIPPETSGAWTSNNGIGVLIQWGLGISAAGSTTAGAWASGNYNGATGAVNTVATAGATLYITGVQFEVGGVATAFERRNFGIELTMCQRYYQSSYPQGTAAGSADGNGINFVATGTNRLVGASSLAVVMRAAPNAVIYDPGAANTTNQVRNQSNGAVAVTGTAFNSNTTYAFTRVITFSGTPFTAGQDYNFHYTAAAEL
jgi:hypothetical protein